VASPRLVSTECPRRGRGTECRRCIRWASTLVGGLLAGAGAVRVGSWILRLLGYSVDLFVERAVVEGGAGA